jgi:predicted extracellular nuclease
MNANAPDPATPVPETAPQWATLMVATCNLLNLANAGRVFYANQDPYSAREFERKIAWLGQRIQTLNADVLAVQEVWDEAALKAAVHRSGQRYGFVAAPGAENHGGATGAQGTPRVGLVTRLTVESVTSHADFPPACAVQIPGLGTLARFERPVLSARLRTRQGQELQVMTAHLKSKRPKFLQNAFGQPQEDRDDPLVQAVASLRSLIQRGAEAAAFRHLVVQVLHHTDTPLVVLGDFNDGPHSVTTQLIAATSAVRWDRGARDVALFNAWEVQGDAALRRDVAYSHIHEGYPEVLDQVLVSEAFVPGSRFAMGDVRRVEVFNDHLHEGRDRSRSDHGFVRALLRLKN